MSTSSQLGRATALILAVPLLTLAPTTSATSASPTAESAARAAGATPFALKARGFGTKVAGGDLPVGSDTTAFQRIGCTNKAGKVKRSSEADVDVPGLGVVSGITTTLRTTRRKGVVASTSTQRIASVVLAETPLGSLQLRAITSRARVHHDASGFHGNAVTKLGTLVLVPPVGPEQALPLPSPGQPVEIPGLATIKVGPSQAGSSANGAYAKATGLIIDVVPTGTTATVGLARAKMNDGVEQLLFRGASAGLAATGLDGVVDKGRTPLSLMPCQGTLGKLQQKSLAGVDLPGALEVGALSSEQRAKQTRKRARAFERGTVASLDLGGGALTIEGVVGQANLVRKNGRTRFNAKGTTIGQVIADGEAQTFPDTGPLEIPGVASLEPKVVTRTKQTISVVGLRITLLDGTGAVIDLGIAKLGAKRSGRP